MMKGLGGRRRSRHRRFFGLGLLLMGAALGPLIHCLGWGEIPAGLEAMTLGVCLDRHPLGYPTAIFLSGMGSFLVGLALMIRHQIRVQEEAALERRVERVATRLHQRRTPLIDAQMVNKDPSRVVEEIELEEELDFGSLEPVDEIKAEEDAASVMAYLEEERVRRHSKPTPISPELRGLYYPPGMEEAAVLYLDNGIHLKPVADPAERIDNPDLPHTSLEEALRQALSIVMNEGRPVMVRVMPGVYQAGVELPDQVALVNHRLPAEGTVDQRLAWLEEQRQIDHPDRVTFLAPGEGDVAVRLLRGQKQGIFGCYFMGRQGLGQRALELRSCGATAIIHCGFEAFSKGAVVVADSGEDLPGLRVQFLGCHWRGNSSSGRGGALAIKKSVVTVEASVFDSNIAWRGGAIAVAGAEKPFILQRSLLQRNRAIWNEAVGPVEGVSAEEWRGMQGVGGGLLVEGGLARVVDTIFEGNDAAVAGGAIAACGARVIYEATGPDRGVCRENRADAGGAVFVAGWAERPAMIRLEEVSLQLNLAKTMGGAGAAVGQGTLHFEGGEVARNRAVGGKSRGVGGGLVAWRGARIQARKLLVAQNMATGGGGAVAVINAHLTMIEETMVLRNRAEAPVGGGAILAITAPDAQLERLVAEAMVSLPFKVRLDGVRLKENQTAGAGGGLRAGNLIDLPSFPLVLQIRRTDWIAENRSEKIGQGQEIWVEWAKRVKAQDGVRGRLELELARA